MYVGLWCLLLTLHLADCPADPERDYYRLSELPSPAACLPRVQAWAAKWCDQPLVFDPDRSEFTWEGLGWYAYTSADGTCTVGTNPIWRHAFCWEALRVEENALRPPAPPLDNVLAAARELIAQNPLLSGRNWVRSVPNGAHFVELAPSGIVTETGCGYQFGKLPGPPTLVSEHLRTSPPAEPPKLSFEEARAKVEAHLRSLYGDRLVVVESYGAPAEKVPNTCLLSVADSLCIKRVAYAFMAIATSPGETMTPEKYADLSARWRTLRMEERPLLYRPGMAVDAQTREAVGFTDMFPVPPVDGPPALTFGVDGHDLFLNYPPRLIEGVPYLYVAYLDSLLWDGQVTTDADCVKVTIRGHNYASAPATGELTRDGAPWPEGGKVVFIHQRPYLPAAAVSLMTGWKLRWDPKEERVDFEMPRALKGKLKAVFATWPKGAKTAE